MDEFRRAVRMAQLPDGVSRHSICATDHERAAIAKRLGLDDLLNLTAAFELTRPYASPIVDVNGQLVATVRQICTVTLEPFESEVTEDFSTRFTTEPAASADMPDVEVEPIGEDMPEPVHGGRIDLGELAVQYLSLALDPHPSRPDMTPLSASFGAPDPGPEDGSGGRHDEDNPFAVLERWQRRP